MAPHTLVEDIKISIWNWLEKFLCSWLGFMVLEGSTWMLHNTKLSCKARCDSWGNYGMIVTELTNYSLVKHEAYFTGGHSFLVIYTWSKLMGRDIIGPKVNALLNSCTIKCFLLISIDRCCSYLYQRSFFCAVSSI